MKKILESKKIKAHNVFIFAFIAILIDQLSKFWIDNYLNYIYDIDILSGIVSLKKIYNTGAAFSLLQDNVLFLSILSASASLLIIFYFLNKIKKDYLFSIIGWGLILGGTIGNLIDRLIYGHVIDFIKLDFVDFPIFNFADVFINIGAMIIIVYIIFGNNSEDDSRTLTK